MTEMFAISWQRVFVNASSCDANCTLAAVLSLVLSRVTIDVWSGHKTTVLVVHLLASSCLAVGHQQFLMS